MHFPLQDPHSRWPSAVDYCAQLHDDLNEKTTFNGADHASRFVTQGYQARTGEGSDLGSSR
jgi:hypothetical protein